MRMRECTLELLEKQNDVIPRRQNGKDDDSADESVWHQIVNLLLCLKSQR